MGLAHSLETKYWRNLARTYILAYGILQRSTEYRTSLKRLEIISNWTKCRQSRHKNYAEQAIKMLCFSGRRIMSRREGGRRRGRSGGRFHMSSSYSRSSLAYRLFCYPVYYPGWDDRRCRLSPATKNHEIITKPTSQNYGSEGALIDMNISY